MVWNQRGGESLGLMSINSWLIAAFHPHKVSLTMVLNLK